MEKIKQIGGGIVVGVLGILVALVYFVLSCVVTVVGLLVALSVVALIINLIF